MTAHLPSRWIDEIFKRFSVAWGAQKTRGMFAAPEGMENTADWAEDVHNLWAEQLGAYSGEVIGRALQAAVDSGRDWPPTLPEFKALCADYRRSEVADAPSIGMARTAPPQVALDALHKVSGGAAVADPLFWAKYPKSAKAVEMMVVGCQRDPTSKLAPILRAHLKSPADVPCRGDDARAALVALAANPPAFLRPRPVR